MPHLTSALTDELVDQALDQLYAFAEYIETGDTEQLSDQVKEVLLSGEC